MLLGIRISPILRDLKHNFSELIILEKDEISFEMTGRFEPSTSELVGQDFTKAQLDVEYCRP